MLMLQIATVFQMVQILVFNMTEAYGLGAEILMDYLEMIRFTLLRITVVGQHM